MGYYIEIQGSEFHIPKDKKAEGLKLIKDLMATANKKGSGGSYSGGKCTQRWFSWVNTEDVLKAKTFEEAMKEWGYPVETDDHGDVVSISHENEKIGDEAELFHAIAPVVAESSYIAMIGEDHAMWRWYFSNGVMEEQEGTVAYK